MTVATPDPLSAPDAESALNAQSAPDSPSTPELRLLPGAAGGAVAGAAVGGASRRGNWGRSIPRVVDATAARTAHPAGRARLHLVPDLRDEDGSLVAEYGLLVVLGATITMLATKWASGGAIWNLFGSVLDKAKALVGM